MFVGAFREKAPEPDIAIKHGHRDRVLNSRQSRTGRGRRSAGSDPGKCPGYWRLAASGWSSVSRIPIPAPKVPAPGRTMARGFSPITPSGWVEPFA